MIMTAPMSNLATRVSSTVQLSMSSVLNNAREIAVALIIAIQTRTSVSTHAHAMASALTVVTSVTVHFVNVSIRS